MRNERRAYKPCRVTSVAQEQSSAMPAGVRNVFEDSDDDGEYYGEQKEIAKEVQELRQVSHLINVKAWDAAAEGCAKSPNTGKVIDLRLDWNDVRKKLQRGSDAAANMAPQRLVRAEVEREFDLGKLDLYSVLSQAVC